jgi:hypothetical protein
MAGETCGCDESKALRVELAELREAAHLVLAWIDRSVDVGKHAAQRLERALAQSTTREPCDDWCDGCRKERHGLIAPHTPRRRCGSWNMRSLTCELPEGHRGEHRCCQIRWAQ